MIEPCATHVVRVAPSGKVGIYFVFCLKAEQLIFGNVFRPFSREGNFGLPVHTVPITLFDYGTVPAPAFEVLRYSGANSPIGLWGQAWKDLITVIISLENPSLGSSGALS